MNIVYSIAVIALAALVHACFQLSVSVLTILSAHTLGAKRSQAHLMKLSTGFLAGATVMTLLLLGDIVLVLVSIFDGTTPEIIWAIACGLSLGVAIAIWLFYFQRTPSGTALWIPRTVAKYLDERTRSTKSSAEAFSLGLSSVFGELLFIVAPLFMAGIVISNLPSNWRLAGIAIYAVISLLSLIIVWVLIGSGHSIGKIQRWRENNKRFMQFSAGAGLFILAFFVFVNQILSCTVGGI